MERPECKVDTDGTQRWYLNDALHREDGPAVEDADGSRCWYLHGELHRADGPAIEWATGTRRWYLNDELHRADGPAIEWSDGTREWYLHGMKLTFDQWCVKLAIDDTFKTLLLLKYSDELGWNDLSAKLIPMAQKSGT